MALIVGNYQLERNENMDEYFKAIGVPYMARKMIAMQSPRLEISQEDDKWTVRTITMIRTQESTFKLNEEYEETMPNGTVLKNVTTMDGDSLVTSSTTDTGDKLTRRYDFSEEQVILTMTHEKSGVVGKRYFKRLT